MAYIRYGFVGLGVLASFWSVWDPAWRLVRGAWTAKETPWRQSLVGRLLAAGCRSTGSTRIRRSGGRVPAGDGTLRHRSGSLRGLQHHTYVTRYGSPACHLHSEVTGVEVCTDGRILSREKAARLEWRISGAHSSTAPALSALVLPQ